MRPTTIPQSLSLLPQQTAPSSPVVGQIYLDGTQSPAAYLQWNGTAWVPFGSLSSQVVPVAMAGNLAGQSVPNGTYVDLLLSDVNIDNNALVDSVNNQIVIQEAGIYEIYAQSGWNHAGGGVETDIHIDGNFVAFGLNSALTPFTTPNVSYVGFLNVGAIIKIKLYQTSGTPQSTVSGSGIWTNYIYVNKVPNAAAQQDSARPVVGSVRKSTTQSLPSAVLTKIVGFDAPQFDPEGLWDATNSRWVIAEPGYYQINGEFIEDGVAAAAAVVCAVYVNGVLYDYTGHTRTSAATGAQYAGGTVIAQLNSGDFIELYAYQDGGATQSLLTDPNYNSFQIAKINPEPTSVSEGALVAMSAYLSTPTAVTAGATIIFDVEEFDTNNAYNPATGVFTAAVGGFYQVTACGQAVTGAATFYVQKNGVSVGYLETVDGFLRSGTILIRLNQGDTLLVKADNSATLAGLAVEGKVTYLQIQRVGA